MNASDIIARARSIADLPNNRNISHLDELNSLNESFKDVYSALVNNDDDYYTTDFAFSVTSSNAVSNGVNEYLVPLPSDFYKLRTLDYFANNSWYPVMKFPLMMKDRNPGDPYYRLKGTNLWLIGGAQSSAVSQAYKMSYYPPPPLITMPQTPMLYGTSYTLSTLATLSAPCYVPLNQTFIYANPSFVITAESSTLGTIGAPVALFTESAAPTNIVYNQGTLYWIRGGSIWYKATQLAVAFTAPVQVGALTGVVAFTINANIIYYVTATAIRSCTLTGGSDSLIMTVAALDVAVFTYQGTPIVFYITSLTNGLSCVLPAVSLYASNISAVTEDGTYLYILDTSNNLRKETLAIVAGVSVAVTTDLVIDTDVLSIGECLYDQGQAPPTNLLPVQHFQGETLTATDVSTNYSFSYPANAMYEIMEFASAVDFRMKQGTETVELKEKLYGVPGVEDDKGLWGLFMQTGRRDDFQPTRIGNFYQDFQTGTT